MVRPAATALALAVTLLGLSAYGNETVLLDFASPFCGPCHQMDPIVQALAAAGYPIRHVDVTREQELAAKFGVSRIPCFVMLADGREVDRVVGAVPGQRLEQMFQRAKASVPPSVPSNSGIAGGQERPSSGTPLPPKAQVGPQRELERRDGSQSPGELAVDPKSAASLLSATVRLRVDDQQGRSFGTGTIIDARRGEALIVTCGHLFRESKGAGQITVDLYEVVSGAVRSVGQVPGKIISYDLDRDVALVSIKPNRTVGIAPVGPPQTKLDRGDRVTSVGCSNGQDPTVLSSRVTSIDRYQGAPNVEASGAPVEGRSGGGLFNSQGQLVGICYAADYEGNEGLYASLESVHGELDRLKLSDIYKGPSSAQPDNLVAVREPAAGPSVVRGQEPLTSVMPIPNRDPQLATNGASGGDSPRPPTAAPGGLRPVEQAALDEINKQAAKSEVLIIIRSKEPGGKSDVIQLDNASPEFVREISSRPRAAEAAGTR